MRISFSPQRRDDTLALEKSSGDRLRINGELFNFNPLPDGATIPAAPCDWITGPVERIDGEIHLTLILPHGPSPEPWQAFPEPMLITEDGPIDIPVDTYSETTEEAVGGGTNVIVTTYRWRQPPSSETTFVPEEPADVDA